MSQTIPVKELTFNHFVTDQFKQLFDQKLTEVFKNIQDGRTQWFSSRKIMIQLEVVPEDDSRETAKVNGRMWAVLAPSSMKLTIKVDLTNQLYFQEQGFSKLGGKNESAV